MHRLRAGLWPRTRYCLITDDAIVVGRRGVDEQCNRKSVRRCVVAWTYGTPRKYVRRTRFDAWTVRWLDNDGNALLTVDNAQEFGAGAIKCAAGILDVPFTAPPDWESAQRRWNAFRMDAGGG